MMESISHEDELNLTCFPKWDTKAKSPLAKQSPLTYLILEILHKEMEIHSVLMDQGTKYRLKSLCLCLFKQGFTVCWANSCRLPYEVSFFSTEAPTSGASSLLHFSEKRVLKFTNRRKVFYLDPRGRERLPSYEYDALTPFHHISKFNIYILLKNFVVQLFLSLNIFLTSRISKYISW